MASGPLPRPLARGRGAEQDEWRPGRRRRRSTPWIQRNALSIAAVGVLAALLGVGFGLLQLLTRSEPAGMAAATPAEQPAATATPAEAAAPAAAPEPTREIQHSERVLEPDYTAQPGDTLARIAARFDTSVERIQGLNQLDNPRHLRVGQKLVIPPPL